MGAQPFAVFFCPGFKLGHVERNFSCNFETLRVNDLFGFAPHHSISKTHASQQTIMLSLASIQSTAFAGAFLVRRMMLHHRRQRIAATTFRTLRTPCCVYMHVARAHFRQTFLAMPLLCVLTILLSHF